EFLYHESQNCRLQTKRSPRNSLEIINPDAISNSLSQFRGMRFRRERLDISINVSHQIVEI
ncbi:unnamed protein product, partial [Hymenolepis diminuta]